MTKTKNLTIDALGGIVKGEFERLDKIINKNHKELMQGQENIELRLTNVAYRFELQELQQRVAALEKKIRVKK